MFQFRFKPRSAAMHSPSVPAVSPDTAKEELTSAATSVTEICIFPSTHILVIHTAQCWKMHFILGTALIQQERQNVYLQAYQRDSLSSLLW